MLHPRSLAACPWKGTILRGKSSLPIIFFQGRTVTFWWYSARWWFQIMRAVWLWFWWVITRIGSTCLKLETKIGKQGCRFVPYTFSETIRHRWDQAGSKYWFPGFGFDSTCWSISPNCKWKDQKIRLRCFGWPKLIRRNKTPCFLMISWIGWVIKFHVKIHSLSMEFESVITFHIQCRIHIQYVLDLFLGNLCFI